MTTPPSHPSNDRAPLIVPLPEAASQGLGVEAIGSKAANLVRLAAAGLPVPPAVVIPAGAFGDPDRLAAALPAAAATLGDRVAVRSSAVAEDLAHASYAGLYDSLLAVAPGQLADAVWRIHASGAGARVAAYQQRQGGQAGSGGMAVLIQQMLTPSAAGVAFTANPVTGARDQTVITAVTGLGERLVAGQSGGEGWVVSGEGSSCTRQADPAMPAITAAQARALAALARRVQDLFGGVPQDIEWAIQDHTIWLLQARPMTALPDPVTWTPPAPGVWLRSFRLGEWLPDPMTPLFADWLLPCIQAGFAHGMRTTAGVALPFRSAAINGWYYTSPNPDPRGILRALVRTRGRVLGFVWWALVAPFRDPVAADRRLLAGLAERWRTDLLPRYERLVATGEREADTADPARLVSLVEAVATLAGEHLWSLAVVGGAAWKIEAALARFHRRHLTHLDGDRGRDGGVQRLLAGLPGTEPDLPAHAVHSIDPVHPTAGELGWQPDRAGGHQAHRRLATEREAATAQRITALAGTPRRGAEFTALLEVAQRYAVVREAQARSLTLGWPLLRRCLLRLGQTLTAAGALDHADDVFFLTRADLDTGLDAGLEQHASLREAVASGRATWTRQRDRKSTRLNSSHSLLSRMPSSA